MISGNIQISRVYLRIIGATILILLMIGGALGAGFRLPVTVGVGGFERVEKPVDINVNFTQLFKDLGKTGTLDENSIQIVETDGEFIIY